ncbi:MAG: hypothetical protein IJ735_02530, partial [Clostridia bacterium]|nr:hypothetical protein [Clostridia bacterium]
MFNRLISSHRRPVQVVASIVVALILIASLFVLGVTASDESASAAVTLTLKWAQSSIIDIRVASATDMIATYQDAECNVYPVDMAERSDWVTTFLNNEKGTTALLSAALDFYCEYVDPDSNETNTRSIAVTKTVISNAPSTLVTSADGHAYIPIYSKNDSTTHTKPYAILESCTVSGKDYTGNTYNNVDIYSITKAGLYTVAKQSRSSIKLRFVFDYNATTDNSGGTSYRLNSGSVTQSQAALEAPDIQGELNALCQAKLRLTATMANYINDNLGIPAEKRTYDGETDFRSLVVLHSTSSDNGGSFVFSTKTTSYNVSSSDIRRFSPITSADGFGTISAQNTNIESGANTSATNLVGLTSYLKLVWYRGIVTEEGKAPTSYDKLSDTDEIRSAATYKLKIESSTNLDFEVNAIVVYYDGKEYEQSLVISKRVLYVDVNNGAAIKVEKEKEYDQGTDAFMLFTNQSFGEDYWTEYMGGLPSSYTALSSYITGDGLFVFDDSFFDDAVIGKSKTVYMRIKFLSVLSEADPEAAEALEGYDIRPIKGPDDWESMSGKDFLAASAPCAEREMTTTDTNEKYIVYEVGSDFRITSNSVKITLMPALTNESTGETEPPFNEITYGDVKNASDFNLAPYCVASNTVKVSGVIRPEHQQKWKIVFKTDAIGTYTSDASSDTLFVVVRLGEKLASDDTSTTVNFVDAYGERYTLHNGNIYAGDNFEYYFYYEVYAAYASDPTNPVRLTVPLSGEKLGIVEVPQSRNSNNIVLELDVGDLLPLSVNKKEVTFDVDVETEKDYDGTNAIYGFNCTASGVLTDDLNYVKVSKSARFGHAGAGYDIPIVYDLGLVPKDASVAEDLFNLISDSYIINTSELKYDEERHPLGIYSGTIKRLDLTVEFAETEYSRMYDTLTYVIVLAKEGETRDDDLYYYYLRNEEGGSDLSGFATESEIRQMQGFEEGSLLIKLKISGFLPGEGFAYEGSNVEDFLYSKLTDDPSGYSVDPMNTFEILSWIDTSRVGNVDINKLTTSSRSVSDKYRLELFEDLLKEKDDYDRYRYTGNYRLVPKTNSYGWLYIEKLDVSPEDIIITEQTSTNYLEYNGGSNGRAMFENDKINYSNHKESEEIDAIVGSTPETMLSIVSFSSTDVIEHEIEQSLINNFVVAGVYMVTVTIPATSNYNQFVTEPFEVVINRKVVDVFVTYPWRVYGDDELVYEQYRYITDIAEHTVRANIEHEIVGEDEVGDIVYAYNGDLDSGNIVLYQGFIGGETIGDGEDEQQASVSISIPGGVDAAGTHINAVTISGAIKNNYSFRYNSANLYVKRRPLNITAAGDQSKNYTGNQVNPDYTITGGPGVLAMYIIRYNGVDILNDEGKEDETKTDVIESGDYVVKVYAKPDASQGASSENYDASVERLVVNLSVLRTEVRLLESARVAVSEYDGDPYRPQTFDNYFQGVSALGEDIAAKYEWGTVVIKSFRKEGEATPVTDVDTLINSGVYTLNMSATITNVENVYFLVDETEKTAFDFTVQLTIEKSKAIGFDVSYSANQGIRQGADRTEYVDVDGVMEEVFRIVYQKYYDGKETAFSYSLTAVGQDFSNGQLNVVTAVDGTLFAINQHAFYVDDPVYNDTAARNVAMTISGVTYDITGRNRMLNEGEYHVVFYINSEESEDYNENFITLKYEYIFVVEAAPLYVYIGFEEDYGPYKIYRTPNAEVEEHSYMIYDGWIEGEDQDPDILATLVAPVIDWSEVDE